MKRKQAIDGNERPASNSGEGMVTTVGINHAPPALAVDPHDRDGTAARGRPVGGERGGAGPRLAVQPIDPAEGPPLPRSGRMRLPRG